MMVLNVQNYTKIAQTLVQNLRTNKSTINVAGVHR